MTNSTDPDKIKPPTTEKTLVQELSLCSVESYAKKYDVPNANELLIYNSYNTK